MYALAQMGAASFYGGVAIKDIVYSWNKLLMFISKKLF